MSTNEINTIRKDLEGKIGRKVDLTAYGTRKKKIQKSGTIKSTYPSIFVIRIDNESKPSTNMTFSYTDIITKAVDLQFTDNEKS
ncbi:MAG: Veg family protein [Clostridia bacterium]